MMRRWALFLSICGALASPTIANARSISVGGAGPSTTSTSRGPFSLHVGYGIEENRILNSDGTSSAYSGSGLMGNLDLRLGGAGPGEFRLFGMAKNVDSKAKLLAENRFDSQTYAGGLKVFALNWLYFGGGMGVTHQQISSGSESVSVTNQYYFAQAGIELHLVGNFYLHAQGLAQVNPVRRTDTMTSHSVVDGFGAFLMLTFSPSDTFVTNVFK